MRRQLREDRRLDQPTRQIAGPAQPSPPQAPQPGSPPPTVIVPAAPYPGGPPRAPAPPPPNVAVPAPRPQAQAGYAPQAPPAPSHDVEGKKTVIVDVGSLFKSQVVGVLVAIEGEFEGEVYKLNDGENKIGRSKDCHVQLPSDSISRPHAVLIYKEGMFAIRTLAPDNPTYVNGERVSEVTQLSDGDSVKLGRTLLRFRSIS